jgi:hypothetical protein
MKVQVLELIEWCDRYNGGELLAYDFNERGGSSFDEHKLMRAIHKRAKRMVDSRDSADYAEAISLMDRKFGMVWRRGGGGACPSKCGQEWP